MTQPIDENIVLPPPPYTSPLLDSNGLLSVSWLTWYRQLYLRTGQAVAPSNTQILTNPMTTFGDILYENATPAIERLPGNTTATKNFLTQTGNGSSSASPGWNTIQVADVPTLNQNTTGTAGGLSVTLPINQGGTGQITKSTAFDALSPLTTGGDLLYGGASGTGTRLANGSSGQVLKSNGTTTAPSWTTDIAGNAANVTGTVVIGNGGTGQTAKAAGFDALSPMTTGGDIIYGGASGTGTRLANGTAGYALTSNGTTLAPSWQPVTATAPNSEIWLDTGNGNGSTNTAIRRFTNNPKATGTDMTYADSATNGMSVTINTAGIYSISYSDSANGNRTIIGISRNSSQLTTSIMTITAADRLLAGGSDLSSVGGDTTMVGSVSVTTGLSVSDVIRAHNNGNCNGTGAAVKFVITRVA